MGNHDLYNFDRQKLARLLGTAPEGREFYSFKPAPGWKVVVLDPYQVRRDAKCTQLTTLHPREMAWSLQVGHSACIERA